MATKKTQETFLWTVNVKYDGKRYQAGEQAVIKADDREELLTAGLIREEAQNGRESD
ncbi:hypothetical protein [Brevibacillus brevis]|uniref:DUF7210 family protein n=1 Tax=Brevibacillus brevis TaxID=1393 RepID=UPI0018FF6A54|nr:hypothetical protein [Brevibacillus brevis]